MSPLPTDLTISRGELLRVVEAEQRKRQAERKQKAAAEKDLLEFIRMFWHITDPAQPLVVGWPLEAIVDHLMATERGDTLRLLMNVPPGFSKSTASDVFFPAWIWGPRRRPHMRFFCTSYSQYLTERDNHRFLRVVTSPLYQRHWSDVFAITHDGVQNIRNDKTGWKLATSVGGIGAGERANIIIIDDPNNTDPKRIESAVQRESVNGWVREVMPDRLNDLERDSIICIQQRTHGSDVSATLLEYGTDYTHLVIPMEYDPTRHCSTVLERDEGGDPVKVWEDPRGLNEDGERLPGVYFDRQGNAKVRLDSPAAEADGELAWPERFSAEKLAAMKTIKGPFAWAGQYQQIPSPRGGGIILAEWWSLWDAPEFPEFELVIVSLDTAFKEGQDNDYNAYTVWGVFRLEDRVKVMLVNAWRGRCSLPELVHIVGTECKKRKADYLLIEDKARGHDTAAAIRTSFGTRHWSTVLINPGHADKVERLKAVQQFWAGDVRTDPITGKDVWSGGMIYAPDRDYADNVIRQMEAFPKVEHDDETDTASMAINWLRLQGVLERDEEFDEAKIRSEIYEKPQELPYDV